MPSLQTCLFKYIIVAAFHIYAQCGKMLQKGEVGGLALNSHGNYIVDHGKSWKNHGIVFFNFCGNLDIATKLLTGVTRNYTSYMGHII